MAGTLFLVATPIGNYDDITVRALNTLKSADIIVCEERTEGLRLLRQYGIEKQIETLNEHNETASASILIDLLKDGKSLALVSDCGTPVFSDPGRVLVERAIQQHINIVPLPGASSLMPALIVSGFVITEFVFAGFLSPKRERRIHELQLLRKEHRTGGVDGHAVSFNTIDSRCGRSVRRIAPCVCGIRSYAAYGKNLSRHCCCTVPAILERRKERRICCCAGSDEGLMDVR